MLSPNSYSFDLEVKIPSFTPNYANYPPLDMTPLDNEEFLLWLGEFSECLGWFTQITDTSDYQIAPWESPTLWLTQPNFTIMNTFPWDTNISCQLLPTIH